MSGVPYIAVAAAMSPAVFSENPVSQPRGPISEWRVIRPNLPEPGFGTANFQMER
jgi:hypothetical protein